MEQKKGKVVLIGLGNVGTATLNSLVRMGIASEVVVINRNEKKARGAVLDANHTIPFNNSPNVEIRTGDYSECRDAQVIIVAAGPSIKPGDRDRGLVASDNIRVLFEIMTQVSSYTKSASVIMVTNPNDLMVYLAWKYFDYPRHLIMGTGTLIDSARMNKILADLCDLDPKNVNGFVLGEHGNYCFTPWSTVSVACVPAHYIKEEYHLKDDFDLDEVHHEVRLAGFEILDLLGYTSWGVSQSACRIAQCIIRNEKSVIPISTVVNGPYGIQDVALSLPCMVSEKGIAKTLELPLNEKEKAELSDCLSHIEEKQRAACLEADKLLARD